MTPPTPTALRAAAMAANRQWENETTWSVGLSDVDAAYIALATPATVLALLDRVEKLEAALSRLAEWTHRMGAALCPPGADTYGEGMRDAKEQVGRILAALEPAP